ncbi:hypothetical protein DVA67_022790 [Solirubrobacter sp. CPCC 204708]|uniref:Uncharacterized protein n=1 Tax=Solirubrobacter deserti TaxID=2282478 RepID=A0ABT4RIP0_9ACTN|nr:hypothetical protein [Solirubrobacter deserti]MBE2318821.1 hypothetical protein [Solirubrobacter deserti]MDA0138201.1 hypothetical protein [Solirubrobacter deserti]
MRRLADQLVAMGRQVGQAAHQMNTRVTDLPYEGPAAQRLRHWANDQQVQAAQTKGKLDELAHYLRREAQALEEAQRLAVPAKR